MTVSAAINAYQNPPAMNYRKDIHHKIYIGALLLLSAGLPLSIWLTTVSEILLCINWLAEGDFRYKLSVLKTRKSLWFISMLYILHLTGLIFTSDFTYGLHDLKIKLPVLLLPLIIGTSRPIKPEKLKAILFTFIAATLIGTLVSFSIFTGIYSYEYTDIREISVFISHIRFSMMIAFAVLILLYFIFTREENFKASFPLRIIFFIAVLWLAFSLFILKTLTGIAILTIILYFLSWKYSGMITESAPRFIVRVLLLTFPLIFFSFVTRSVMQFYQRENINFSELDTHTIYGNKYFHDTLSAEAENGNYTWIYLCEEELRKGWNALSDYKYDSKDKKGQELKYTLIRYMTSKGLRKDMNGLNKLYPADISAIENGNTNYLFLKWHSIYPRVYEIIWELDGFFKGRDPGGHSIAQRIIYLKAAIHIISKHPISGTGTGDVQKEFNRYYDEYLPLLKEKWRRRAHNQYLTFMLSFGIPIFLIAIASLILPPFIEKKWNNYFFVVFFLIITLSMLNEDTLETQTGVSFVMFFYSVLIFAYKNEKNDT